MQIPKILTDKMKKVGCIKRHYPKTSPQPEQITVSLESVALEGKPTGFLVCRFLMKPTENPKEFLLESPFETHFFEPKEILIAIEEFKKDSLPKLLLSPANKFIPKPWDRPPRLTLERKKIPEKNPAQSKKSEILDIEK